MDLLTQQGYYRDRPQFKTTLDQLQYAREAPLTPHWPAIAKEITKGMEEALVNNVPAAQALKKAQERAQAIVRLTRGRDEERETRRGDTGGSSPHS